MRLTKKYAERLGTTIGMPLAVECYWKLRDLEDIEEELGIDLITLFKAFKNRFAYMFVQNDYNENYKKGLVKPLVVSNFYKYGEDYKLVLCDTLTCLSYYVSVKDYSKTWALTKEELL